MFKKSKKTQKMVYPVEIVCNRMDPVFFVTELDNSPLIFILCASMVEVSGENDLV